MKPIPLTKDQARRALAKNAHRISWDEPEKIAVADISTTDAWTLVDLLCAAYDLQRKEDIENLERVRNKIYIKPCNPI